MLKFVLLGFLIGYIFAGINQVSMESDYVKNGIAKIYGKYYHITPFNKEDEDNGLNKQL